MIPPRAASGSASQRSTRMAKSVDFCLRSAKHSAKSFAACSQTAAPGQNIVQRVEGEQPAPPPPTGFLGSDYSLLQPPSSGSVPGQKAMLAYINPNANFSQYNQVMIAQSHIGQMPTLN